MKTSPLNVTTVLSRRAAYKLYGQKLVRRELKARRWRAVRGAVVLHNGPLTWEERAVMGLVVKLPQRAALDGRTSLFVAGVLEERPARAEIALPRGARQPVIPGVTFRWVSDLALKSVDEGWLRRLKTAHALLRALHDVVSEREARALVSRALQSEKVAPAELKDALGPTPRGRHSALVAEVIEDFISGIHSVPEKDYDEILVRYGLPRPTRQRIVRGEDGRYYLDSSFDEYNLSSEVHGWHHFKFLQREADFDRKNDVVADGRRILEFSSWQVRRQKDKVGRVLVRGLRSAGWRG